MHLQTRWNIEIIAVEFFKEKIEAANSIVRQEWLYQIQGEFSPYSLFCYPSLDEDYIHQWLQRIEPLTQFLCEMEITTVFLFEILDSFVLFCFFSMEKTFSKSKETPTLF